MQSNHSPRATGAACNLFPVGSFVALRTTGALGIVTRSAVADGLGPWHAVTWTDGTSTEETGAELRRAKRPLGFIVYEGPSAIDGAPVVAIVNAYADDSANGKTGRIAQSWILRADVDPMAALRSGADASVCGQCPHRPTIVAAAIAAAIGNGASARAARAAAPARCYVNVGRAPAGVWDAYRRGRYVRVAPAFLRVAMRGRVVRLGAYGDPAAVPAFVWRAYVADAAAHTGYSHQWARLDVATWGPLVMASVDSLDEQRAAVAAGWRAFRVSVDASDKQANEARCPAAKESGARATCADCRLCGGTTRAARSIVILDHAPGWQSRRVIPLQLAA